MSEHIRIKKGLDIPLTGEAQLYVAKRVTSGTIALRASDFRGLKASPMVSEGDTVVTGQPVFCDITRNDILFCSPACGRISSMARNEDGTVSEIFEKYEAPYTKP